MDTNFRQEASQLHVSFALPRKAYRRLALASVISALGGMVQAAPPANQPPYPPTDPEGEYCLGNSPREGKDIMVRVGPLCVDKYEATVWSQQGAAGVQYPQANPRYPTWFPVTGNWTKPLFAASVKGVQPSTFLTWFQAQQACALSGKRLLTNAEWQMAAAGTPDPGLSGDGAITCNSNTPTALPTGAAAACVSRWGVRDMVGNVSEWVADWIQGGGVSANGSPYAQWAPNNHTRATPTYGDDIISGINESPYMEAPQTGYAISLADAMPAAISRGGYWLGGTGNGVFALDAGHTPTSLDNATGFRCAR